MADIQAVDRAGAAFLRSCTEFGSGQWLHAVPLLHYFTATPAEWQMMWNTRLGVEAVNAQAVARCKCGVLAAGNNILLAAGKHLLAAGNLTSSLSLLPSPINGLVYRLGKGPHLRCSWHATVTGPEAIALTMQGQCDLNSH
jgi:hypothetical protein